VTCTHIFNAAFDPARMRYSRSYENALHFSETFARFQRRLAERLIERFDLRGKDLVEVGCGDGAFLRLLCELGDNRGVGFDATAPLRSDSSGVRFVATADPAAYAGVPADFICCRQTLEHVEQPRRFIADLRQWARASPPFYFEVPNGLAPFCDGAVWDLIYEHCSYFTPRSLQRLCAEAGMEVWTIDSAFDSQFLSIEGRFGDPRQPHGLVHQADDLHARLAGFSEVYAERISAAAEWTQRATTRGDCIVLWGAGSKGSSFLDAAGGAAISAAVDVNPRKQGRWIGGSSVEVVAPQRLSEIEPDRVVILNPIYRDEVGAALSAMSLAPEVVTF
jgi:SAM-dependent methyltransferase